LSEPRGLTRERIGPENFITGHRCVGVEQTGGRVTARFADGSTDLVVTGSGNEANPYPVVVSEHAMEIPRGTYTGNAIDKILIDPDPVPSAWTMAGRVRAAVAGRKPLDRIAQRLIG